MGLEYHKLADVLPLLEGLEFEELVRDVRANGQRVPIVLHDGKILDGRNRYRACRVLGIEPKTIELAAGADPVAFVVSANLRRRHLTPGQAAMIAAELANATRGGNQGSRKVNASAEAMVVTQDDAAGLCRVSRSSVQRAVIVRDRSPQVAAEVKAGHLSLKEACRIVRQGEKAPDAPKATAKGAADDLKASVELLKQRNRLLKRENAQLRRENEELKQQVKKLWSAAK